MKYLALFALCLSQLACGQATTGLSGRGGISGTAGLGTANIVVTSIAITPPNPSAVQGSTVGFTATIHLSNGTTQNVTTSGNWTYSNTHIAAHSTLSTTENTICVSPGSARVGVTYGLYSTSTGITCTANVPPAPTLSSIAVTPGIPSISVGASQGFTATGTYSDGSTQPLTASATWASSNTTNATLGTLGVTQPGICAHGGTSTISATDPVTSISGSTVLTCNAVLTSINVGPATASILAGSTQAYIATCNFNDGSSANCSAQAAWTSSAPAKATIPATTAGSTNTATALTAGSTTITAAIGSVSGTSALTVTQPGPPPATLSSLAITPAAKTINVGGTLDLIATCTYSDGSTQNCSALDPVSGTATVWTTSQPTRITLQLADAIAGTAYSATLSGTGSTPRTWSAPAKTAPAGAVDILDWWLMPRANRDSFHMGGGSGNPRYSVLNAGMAMAIKSSGGMPQDGRFYDDNYLYFGTTDNGDPADQQACINAGYPGGCFLDPFAYKLALNLRPFSPRYFVLGGPDVTINDPAPNLGYATTNCAANAHPPRDLGNVATVTHDAGTSTNWGGDVGSAQTIIVNYYRSLTTLTPPYQSGSRERYYMAAGFGVFNYDSADWNGTSYGPPFQFQNLNNLKVAGGPPTPNFGCGIPTPPIKGLPPGILSASSSALTLDDTTGVISGTPNLAGTYPFIAQQEDGGGAFHLFPNTIRVNQTAATAQQTVNGVAAGVSTIAATIGAISGNTTVTVQNTAPTLASIAIAPATASILTTSTQGFVANGTFSDGSTKDVTTAATWSSSAGGSFSVVTQFDGSAGDGTGTVTRPNSTLASNGTQLFQANQQTFTYYTAATHAVISSTDFLTWLANVSPSIVCTKRSEPRVYYDSFISRWIVVYSCSQGTNTGTWLIVSSGSDLSTATWKTVNTLIPVGDATMRLSFDKNGVYIAGFDTSCSTQDSLVTFPAADLQWSGGGTISTSREQIFSCIELRTMPADDLNPFKALTDPAFLVSVSTPLVTANVAFNLQFRQINWTNSGCGTPPCARLSGLTSVPSGFLANATLNEAQPSGNPLRGSESFAVIYTGSVRQVGTHLYIARPSGPCTAACGTQGVDSHMLFFWWDVNPNTLGITQSGKVSSATVGYLFPALASDQSGNLMMLASGTSSSIDPTIFAWSRQTSDALGALTGPTTVTAGTQVYGCASANPTPWGNYYDLTQDPSGGTTIWGVHEYGGSASDCVWKTRIIGATFSGVATIPSNPTASPNIATPVAAGSTTITAAIGAISGTASLTVTNPGPPPPTQTGVTLAPKPCSQLNGASCSYTLTENFNDGSTKDVTLTASAWTAGTPGNVQMASPFTNPETGKCLVGGGATSTVTGSFGGFSDSTTQTCTTSVATLQSIAVTPANQSISVGALVSYTAIGTYSDGTTKDLTAAPTVWASSNAVVASIQSPAAPQPAKCNSAGGPVTIRATVGAVSGTTNLTCSTPPPPTSGMDAYCGQSGGTDGPAALPLAYYCTQPSVRPTTGTVRAVTQATWNAVWAATLCDDVVEIAPGAIFTGAMTIPSKVCSAGHYRTLRAQNFNASFPAYGSRATPAYWGVNSLPGYPAWPAASNVGGTMQTTSQSQALILAGPISYLQIEGIHILRNSSVFFSDVITKTGTGFDHIILDRIWCSATVAGSTNRCFDSSTVSYDAAIDSFFSDFLCIAGGPGGLCSSDGQALSDGRNNTGVQDSVKKWVNNFAAASSETLFSGGGSANIVPSDFEIRLNWLFKPMTWNPADPSYAFAAIGQPLVKNGLEFKNGNRILIEGNICQNTWVGFDQNGSCVLMTPKSQAIGTSNQCPLCATTNVTGRYNYITTVNYPFQFAIVSNANGAFAAASGSYSFHDWVADNLGYKNCFHCAGNSGNALDGGYYTAPSAPSGIVQKHGYFAHNTFVRAPNAVTKAGLLGISGAKSGTGLQMDDYTWTNNFAPNQRGGSTGVSNPLDSCAAGLNCNCGMTTPAASLNACFITYTFKGNCIVNDGGTLWPGTNVVSNTASETSELVNYNNGLMLPGGDFHLKPGSACHNQATDGFDPGADINTLLNRIAGVNSF